MANLYFKSATLLAFVAIILAQILRISVNGQMREPPIPPLPEEVCGAEGYFVSPLPGYYFRCRLNLAIRRYILHRMQCPTSNSVQQVFQQNRCVPPVLCTAQANSNCLCGPTAKTTCTTMKPFCDSTAAPPVCRVRCTPGVANTGTENCVCGLDSCIPKAADDDLSVCDTKTTPMMPKCIKECVEGGAADANNCQCGLKVCLDKEVCTLAADGAEDICKAP